MYTLLCATLTAPVATLLIDLLSGTVIWDMHCIDVQVILWHLALFTHIICIAFIHLRLFFSYLYCPICKQL
jgi:hypothetical protein